MSSTRTINDKDIAEYRDFSIKNVSEYIMDINKVENVNNCHYSGGARNSVSELSKPLNQNGLLDIENKVKLESYVQNRHLPLGSFKRTNDDHKTLVDVQAPPQCSNITEHLVLDESRLTHPLNDYREMRTDHLNFSPYLHMNPQQVLVSNENWYDTEARQGVASRKLKGSYKTSNTFPTSKDLQPN
jgi:hypothetical protein